MITLRQATRSTARRINRAPQGKEYVMEGFLEAGLVSYEDSGAGVARLNKEAIDKMIPSFVGCPVTIQHTDLGRDDVLNGATDQEGNPVKVGEVTRAWWNADTGRFDCSFKIEDEKAEELVKNGWSGSCAYNVTESGNGGELHAMKYDEEILNGKFEHLALVDNPRYEDCKIRMNGKSARIKEYRIVGAPVRTPDGWEPNPDYSLQKKGWTGNKMIQGIPERDITRNSKENSVNRQAMFDKEKADHPEFTDEQIWKIVEDHEAIGENKKNGKFHVEVIPDNYGTQFYYVFDGNNKKASAGYKRREEAEAEAREAERRMSGTKDNAQSESQWLAEAIVEAIPNPTERDAINYALEGGYTRADGQKAWAIIHRELRGLKSKENANDDQSFMRTKEDLKRGEVVRWKGADWRVVQKDEYPMGTSGYWVKKEQFNSKTITLRNAVKFLEKYDIVKATDSALGVEVGTVGQIVGVSGNVYKVKFPGGTVNAREVDIDFLQKNNAITLKNAPSNYQYATILGLIAQKSKEEIADMIKTGMDSGELSVQEGGALRSKAGLEQHQIYANKKVVLMNADTVNLRVQKTSANIWSLVGVSQKDGGNGYGALMFKTRDEAINKGRELESISKEMPRPYRLMSIEGE